VKFTRVEDNSNTGKRDISKAVDRNASVKDGFSGPLDSGE